MLAVKSRESSEPKGGARQARTKSQASTPPEAAVANPLWLRLATRLQAKLAVSPPDDPYEREAESVAGRIVRMADPGAIAISRVDTTVRRKCSCGGPSRCEKCKEDREDLAQRAATDSAPVDAAPSTVDRVLSSAGQPLQPAARAFFEPRFGQDLSGVRVHADTEAAQSARSVNALAYTVGHNIVFDSGRYAWGSPEGRKLLAHELTHVIQQRGPVMRRVQRTPRTLPTNVDPTNILLFPIIGVPNVRAGTLAHVAGGLVTDTALRERVSAIIGEGATLRGIARTILPMYVTAAIPGAPSAPTEDQLAAALLDYGRSYLAVPAMTGWRAGLRFPLPIELDPDPGPVSHVRNDWILNADDVRTRAASVTAAEAPLVDTAAAAPAAPPGVADVSAFTSARPDNLSRGIGLQARVMSNPFEGAPLATQVLASLSPGDRFEVVMAFMLHTVNLQISMLESLAPGFALLQTLRATLSAPPTPLAPAREADRLSRLGMLPEDPTVTGISADYLSDRPVSLDVDDPNTIFFRRGRTSIDLSEARKLDALRTANAATPLTLSGSSSEEESPSLALARTAAVEGQLRSAGSAVTDVQRVETTAAGARASVGNLAYAEMRRVRITVGPPSAQPNCTTGRTSDPCAVSNPTLETSFLAANTRARDIVDGALAHMSGADIARDAAMARRFGTVSLALLRTRLTMLRATIAAVAGSHECGNTCDASCNGGALAYSQGPAHSPLMVVCDGLRGSDPEMVASILIHESAHATSGMLQAAGAPGRRGPADWAYRWERMSGTIAEMSPNRSLDNADSYTLFVMDLRDPSQIPAGSLPIEEAPSDDFHGTWTSTSRTSVRHGLANCQKWMIWAAQYMADSYGQAARGTTDPTYMRAKVRFGVLSATPGDTDRAMLAGIQSRYKILRSRMSQAMRIEHAAAGAATTFSSSAPLFLWVGSDFLALGSDDARGHFLLRKIVEASPDIDPAQRAAYAELAWDIHGQYALDHP